MSARLPHMRMRPIFQSAGNRFTQETHAHAHEASLPFAFLACLAYCVALGTVMTWVTGKVCFRQAFLRFCASLAERRITWTILPGLGCKQRKEARLVFGCSA